LVFLKDALKQYKKNQIHLFHLDNIYETNRSLDFACAKKVFPSPHIFPIRGQVSLFQSIKNDKEGNIIFPSPSQIAPDGAKKYMKHPFYYRHIVPKGACIMGILCPIGA